MSETRLWYDEPAGDWNEALPVGCGRLGGMVFGRTDHELIQLNEDTLWSGYPKDDQNYQALANLPEARRLLDQRRYNDAHRLITEKMLGVYNQSYQPLGDLHIDFAGLGDAGDYRRELDLARAVASTTFAAAAARHSRQVFASFVDQVLVVRLETTAAEGLNFEASLDCQLRHQIAGGGTEVLLHGQAPCHVDPHYHTVNPEPVMYDTEHPGKGMFFAMALRVSPEGGTATARDGKLVVTGARAATLLLAAATSFDGPFKIPATTGKAPAAICRRTLDAAGRKTYAALLADHERDHHALFDRVDLDLGSSPAADLPTDERLRRVSDGQADAGLVALLLHFGRYLLIASSRPGTQPANAQGIWNKDIRPPWSSNWTVNINAEMNYWPAETCNLAPCHEPLFDLIDELSASGARTARIQHGCGGWTCHHNVDLWRAAIPVAGSPTFAYWPMSAAWLCQHLWEHYLFGLDKGFLARVWPTIRGAAEFLLDWLIEDENGQLITSPSTSPENTFFEPGTRNCVSVTQACAMDLGICHESLTLAANAADELGREPDFARRCRDAVAKLRPLKVGSKGQLLEWDQEFEECDPHHRHQSHMFALYPGRQITAEGTPDLFAACQRSMEFRGDGGTGWSMGWKVAIWARLRDGDHALKMLGNFFKLVPSSVHVIYTDGGIYPNLLCAHPPFQIDGNFGAAAGIAEMLLQSHAGELHLLPALPGAWRQGRVRGLRARGAIEVDIAWRDGRLLSATLRAAAPGKHRLRYGDKSVSVELRPGEEVPFTLDDF